MTEEKLDALKRYFEGHPDLGVVSAYPGSHVSVIDRLAALRRHLDHLHELRPRVTGSASLRDDLSLSNDVLRSLQIVCQAVIDIARDLSARRGQRFQDYTESVRNLAAFPEFPPTVPHDLEVLPGLRNVLIYEYLTLDYARVIEALDRLSAVEKFAEIVRRMEAQS
ncbi:MAG TPA: HepT-like ribonuclease domain-containing protein [Thermoanaerobaculia bacterium]|jgi:uncharacterized protein YutE (UPF0331/DUF86 family)